ncbi:MAG: glycerate kinase [Gammaproteobacteria bacterium]|nr:glycerate kinase [Gammaproteobacteria bacterium]
MRILIAADSFKDALPATAVCAEIADGIHNRNPTVETIEFPLGDGGEGTLDVLRHHLKLHEVNVATDDPLGRPIGGHYGISADRTTAVIEMAVASGLQLLGHEERDPLRASTFGTGRLIAHAVGQGVSRIVLAIGGSATNDGGIGVAAALGWQFVDADGATLAPVGGSLSRISSIIPPATAFPAIDVEVICDVDNPLCGSRGAAAVYGPQKGADTEAVAALDAGLANLARCMAEQHGKVDFADRAGAGAAGGMGYGAMVFMNAQLARGIDLIMELTGFSQALAAADLVITGEGALDSQTLHGKLISGICDKARTMNKPVLALCGRLAADAEQIHQVGLADAFSINLEIKPLAEMLAATGANLRRTAASLDLARYLPR